MNRHANALEIWTGGACNVAAVARALVKACDEVRAEPEFQTPSTDPAVRLIVAQLASLCGVDSTGSLVGRGDSDQTKAALMACEAAK